MQLTTALGMAPKRAAGRRACRRATVGVSLGPDPAGRQKFGVRGGLRASSLWARASGHCLPADLTQGCRPRNCRGACQRTAALAGLPPLGRRRRGGAMRAQSMGRRLAIRRPGDSDARLGPAARIRRGRHRPASSAIRPHAEMFQLLSCDEIRSQHLPRIMNKRKDLRQTQNENQPFSAPAPGEFVSTKIGGCPLPLNRLRCRGPVVSAAGPGPGRIEVFRH